MKKQKSSWSIKLLYWLTLFTFWITTFLVVAVIAFNFGIPSHIFDSQMQINIQMPVPIEVVEEGVLYLEGINVPVRIEKAYGKLHFVDAPQYVVKMVFRVMLVVVLIGWFITWKFKRFITNLKQGKMFEIENINNLKHISYGLVVLFVISRVYMQYLNAIVKQHLEFASINIGGKLFDTDSIIILALVLWALAHVFVKGIEMKEEQELTI